ncbi:MAG: hypothetical protein AAF657_04180 [Acidobacteriota bacterium]
MCSLCGGRSYCRELARELWTGARDADGYAWETRILAALMLESLALRLPPKVGEEHVELFAALGLLAKDRSRLRSAVLREGFSTTELQPFAEEFTARLERNASFHRPLNAWPIADADLFRYLALPDQECRVQLARYLITPDEVVERFLQQVRSGLASVSPSLISNTQCIAEAARLREQLPELEAEIVRQLTDLNQTFWVSERPRQMLNSMVEYPLRTVALVLKPPGSWIEIQFKRAGRPSECPLGVTWLRPDGGTAPYQHQLDGGGYGKGLEWESAAAAKAKAIFHKIHRRPAPVSLPVCVQTVSMLPTPYGPVDIMNYFTHSTYFGDNFESMRSAMQKCVDQAEKERGWNIPAGDDDVKLTMEFLVAMKPSQGILVGSSSFRVDKVFGYLSADGPRIFYQEGLGRGAEVAEQRWLADTVLAEILPTYQPPAEPSDDYGQYVEAAFSVPANRRQADRTYRRLLKQAGRFWGTLLAFGTGSRGESFVARNVGLRNVWKAGRWRIELIFMDHDQLFFYGPRAQCFRPLDSVPSMLVDEEYLVEMPAAAQDTRSVISFLDGIYRADEALRTAGRAAFHKAVEKAYRKTRRLQEAGKLKKFLTRQMTRALADWDSCVTRFLAARRQDEGEHGESELREWLAGRGYGKRLRSEYIEAMRRYAHYLAKYQHLFAGSSSKKR